MVRVRTAGRRDTEVPVGRLRLNAVVEEHRFRFRSTSRRETTRARLVAGLEEDAPLNYHYVFAGIAEDACTVEFSADKILDISRFKDLEGSGRKGYVSRDQVVRIADEIVSTENVTARCGDWTIGSWMTERIMDRVKNAEERVEIRSWDELEKFAGLDPESFRADVETMLRDIEKTVQSKTDSNGWASGRSKAWSQAGEGGVAITGGGSVLDLVSGFFGIGGSASQSESQAKAWAEAKKTISDRLSKRGIYGEWQGTRHLPKSVDVYSTEELKSAWARNMKETYSQTKGRAGTNNFLITRQAHKLSPQLRRTTDRENDRTTSPIRAQGSGKPERSGRLRHRAGTGSREPCTRGANRRDRSADEIDELRAE